MNLSEVIMYGSTQDVAELVPEINDLNLIDEYGYTPLIQCAIMDSIEKAKILLEAGADPNQQDATRRTALHWAIGNDNFELCKLLLKHKADANAYNISSEPLLARPILRDDNALKDLLIQHGASFQFAYDYIYAKLIGHRFELIGSVDIVDTNNVITEVDYEGFYLEFSLDLIGYSLQNFKQNYAARAVSSWFDIIDTISHSIMQAQKLQQHDHYLKNSDPKREAIKTLAHCDPLILPVSQEGHALAIVKFGNLIAICDRATDSPPKDIIPIYYMNRPYKLDANFIFNIVYQKRRVKDIHTLIKKELSAQPIDEVPLPDQSMGNCSWANVEATIPVLAYMLQLNDPQNSLNKKDKLHDAIELFHRWQSWDSNRTLQFVMQEFATASKGRQASIAALLAGVLFQKCSADNPEHVTRAKNIIRILKTRGLEYILESYKTFYIKRKRTKAGENLERLLKIYEQEEV
ncbi:MAG: ankyrin repeat domain-containing protein [Gammaproteobacteria bacterium]|nr:ankyrin repeat domain-containing protein [Gammaproteobacteria bacterium]MCH9744557.1 ankyrin repeat domain-containing protein [Gammaproteobacteria bacterium]